MTPFHDPIFHNDCSVPFLTNLPNAEGQQARTNNDTKLLEKNLIYATSSCVREAR
jgi:hypothetical protein